MGVCVLHIFTTEKKGIYKDELRPEVETYSLIKDVKGLITLIGLIILTRGINCINKIWRKILSSFVEPNCFGYL